MRFKTKHYAHHIIPQLEADKLISA